MNLLKSYGWLATLGLILLWFCAVDWKSATPPEPVVSSEHQEMYEALSQFSSSVGDQSRIRTNAAATFTEGDMDRFNQLIVAGDVVGIREMERDARVVTIFGGTPCTIVDLGFTTSEVRPIEGTWKNRSLFVASNLIDNL